MLTIIQAIILGALQGITELFPVSSLGHSVLLPALLGWGINQKDTSFVTFIVATHFATALVLFLFFLRDWKKILAGLLRSLKKREINQNDSDAKLGWLLIVGTVPAGITGVLFEEYFKNLFAAPSVVAIVLVLNGIMLFGAEKLRKSKIEKGEAGSDTRISKLTWGKSIKVGILQCLALIPGFSRTGSTLTGGLMVGLPHEDAARFSFLLATPIIGAAAVLQSLEIIGTPIKNGEAVIVGSICAGVAAFFSVKFLTKYFERKNLTPFAIYCVIAGLIFTLLLR